MLGIIKQDKKQVHSWVVPLSNAILSSKQNMRSKKRKETQSQLVEMTVTQTSGCLSQFQVLSMLLSNPTRRVRQSFFIGLLRGAESIICTMSALIDHYGIVFLLQYCIALTRFFDELHNLKIPSLGVLDSGFYKQVTHMWNIRFKIQMQSLIRIMK